MRILASGKSKSIDMGRRNRNDPQDENIVVYDDVIRNKILELERVANKIHFPFAPLNRESELDEEDRFPSGHEQVVNYYNERREGLPVEQKKLARPSIGIAIPARALADEALASPQESNAPISPPASSSVLASILNHQEKASRSPHSNQESAIVTRPVGLAMAADFSSFIKSPCQKIKSVMSDDSDKNNQSKIWDFLDPKDDVKPDNRNKLIERKKQEKRAMEEAYRDLMLISHVTDYKKECKVQKPEGKQRRVALSVGGCGLRTGLGSNRNKYLESSTKNQDKLSRNLSDSPITVASEPHDSKASLYVTDFYPRTSDPNPCGISIMKKSIRKPPSQEYYPTQNDLNDIHNRRVRFSKSVDPELRRSNLSPTFSSLQNSTSAANVHKVGILKVCGGGEADEESYHDDVFSDNVADLERVRQELWETKLGHVIQKNEMEDSMESSKRISSKRSGLREFEQTIQNQVFGCRSPTMPLLSTLGTTKDDSLILQPQNEHHMYVAYSRFSKEADEVMQLCERSSIPSPNYKRGELLVKVRVSTISLFDCAVRRGERAEVKLSPYVIPGTAFVGQIPITEKKYPFSKISPGDTVLSLCRSGSNARYSCRAKDQLVKVPPSVSPDEAVCLAETYLTAFQVLHFGQKSAIRHKESSLKGQYILLVVGGFSNLSRALIEVANAGGAKCCYVLVDKEEFHAVSKIGGIPLSKDPQQWLTLIGRQIDLLITCSDHDMFTENISKDHLKALNSGGQVIDIANPGIDNFSPFSEKNRSNASKLVCNMTRSKLHDRTQMYNVFDAWDKDSKQSKRDLEHLLFLLENKKVRPLVLKRLPLNKVAAAQAVLQSKKMTGYFVCLPWGQENM